MKLLTYLLAIASLLTLPVTGIAQDVAPDVLIRNVSNDVLDIVRKDKDIQSGNLAKAIELVEVKVLPHFNFMRMTQLAVGKDWRQATPEQQQVLAGEFRTLLVRTYSKALSEYRNQTISFKPYVLKPEDKETRVKTEVSQASGGKPISIDYYLEKSTGAWKVYDIEIAGVSLITNYRESFGNEIRSNGIDGLIKSLQVKNKANEGAAAKK